MWFGILIFLAVVVIGVTVGLKQGLKQANVNKQLMADGRMIQRNINFVEEMETFKLQNADYETLCRVFDENLNSFDGTGISIKYANEKPLILFEAKDWKAGLVGQGCEEGLYTYNFNFIEWRSHNNVPYSFTAMNVVLTSVEKIFIKIDPNTQVSTQRITKKTRSSMF